MTTIQIIQESVRSAPTEIWQNYDNKNFKDQRIQEVYSKVSSFWKNLFTLCLWGYFKKREIKLLIKDAVCAEKTARLPEVQQRIKDLVAQKLKPSQALAALRKEFTCFKTSEFSLLLQSPQHRFDPVTHWLGVKHYLRTNLYRKEKALAAFDPLIRVSKKEFAQAAAYLKGEARSADPNALRLIARGYVDARNHPALLATLPRRVQELFNNPQAQAGFQAYFLQLKWPEFPALQQSVGHLRNSGATTAVQNEFLQASDHRFTYTSPELAAALLAAPEAAPASRNWALFRNEMREEAYRNTHTFELLAPLFTLSEADQKQAARHFTGKSSTLPQERLDTIVNAAVSLKIYPELFLTLPLPLQKLLRKIPDETLAAAFLALVQPNYNRNLPPHLAHFGDEITQEAIALSSSDQPPLHHPALLRDAPRSLGKSLGWVPLNTEEPGIEISFANPDSLHKTLDTIAWRNHLDAPSRLMLERLLSHDAYGPPVAALNASLNQLSDSPFFAIGNTNREPLSISIVEEEDHSLTLHYWTDLPVTDIYHSSVHERGDGSRYKGDFRIAFTYRLVFDIEAARHRVEGPFIEAPQFTFQPCPPPESELLLPAPPSEAYNPFEGPIERPGSTDPFATPPARSGAATPESENPFSPRPASRGSSIFDDETPQALVAQQAPPRSVSRGSSIFDDATETAPLDAATTEAAAKLFDVPLD